MDNNVTFITKEQIEQFDKLTKELNQIVRKEGMTAEERIRAYRHNFFSCFRLSHVVKPSLVSRFLIYAEWFYNPSSTGYNGIMEEIRDRVTLYADIDGYVAIREFLKHGDGKSDFYDSDNRVSYEKKTGCGDWLRSERYDNLADVIAEYKRKRTMIRWDYEYTAKAEGMTGKKSVNKNLSEEEKQIRQERVRKPSKEYNINIHIETTYKKLFEYMETYPAGINSFFKESTRSGKAGIFLWELQTIKNSKKKIDFLQAFKG